MADKYEAFVHYGPYDEETIEAMYNIRFCGMPVSFLLLDKRKTNTFCHMCSSLLTFAIPGSKRVEGKLVVLDGDEHSWVEVDGIYGAKTDALVKKIKQIFDCTEKDVGIQTLSALSLI